jgi:protein-S-isoprenylcysteine O-methyltransferase Ste14
MVLPTPTSVALTLLLVAPFQWFTVAAAKTFRIPQFSNRGAGLAFVCNIGIFIYMALDDEWTLEASALGRQYAAYKQRVGVLLLLPRRQA